MTKDPFARIAELEEECRLLHALVDQLQHDTVSGLIARRTMEELVGASFARAQRANYDGEGEHFGVILCDIDHFKKVNDEYGHRVGDDVLSAVAGAIKGCTRSSDHAARWGGEEFVCLIGGAGLSGLALLSERIRVAVEDLKHPEVEWNVTVSIGFSLYRVEDTKASDVVERADKAMYKAKESGRNRVAHSELGPDELELIETLDRLNHVSG